MATLKNNIDSISDNTENIARDYWKLFSIKQSEKLALLLGGLVSVFIVITLILILVVFGSFALAGALNKMLVSEFWGFVIVGGVYVADGGLDPGSNIRITSSPVCQSFCKVHLLRVGGRFGTGL